MTKPIRTRISSGPSGLLFLITISLTLGAALYTQANLLFWALGLMVGAFATSIIATYFAIKQISLTRLLPMHGIAGEQLVIRYNIQNRSKFSFFNIIITEQCEQLSSKPMGWILFLSNKHTLMAEAPCWPKQRGKLSLNHVSLTCSFPFGIIKKTITYSLPDELIVYPHIYRLNRRVVGTLSRINPEGSKNIERSGGTEEFFGLREYHTGDSIRLINWKQTAKTGNMVVKEMTQPSPPQTMVQLDLSPAQREAFKQQNPDFKPEQIQQHIENAISLTASIICDAYMHGYQIGLTCPDISAPTYNLHHSLPHRTNILEALAMIDLEDTSPQTTTPPLTEATVCILLTNQVRTQQLGSGTKLTLSAHTLHQYIADSSDNESAESLLNPIGGAA